MKLLSVILLSSLSTIKSASLNKIPTSMVCDLCISEIDTIKSEFDKDQEIFKEKILDLCNKSMDPKDCKLVVENRWADIVNIMKNTDSEDVCTLLSVCGNNLSKSFSVKMNDMEPRESVKMVNV